MSHIYDALRKSGGEEAKRPGGSGSGAAEAAPKVSASASAGKEEIKPEGAIDGALFSDPDVEFLRELDALRSSVDVILGRCPSRVIGFIGAGPDEGTTTVAAHYAYLVARAAEKRVLLIDGDISRSNTCLSEPLAEREGFTECVAGIIPLERAVLATEEPRLHFMPSGKDRVHYGDAIGAGALRPLLERCGALYDVVVIDLAPALMNAEAPVIASACDGVVLVVRAHRTRREIVRRAVAELGFAKCRVLGTVLNARRETLPRFLRERV